MMVRSRAPLRLGLAGGGTDVSPYSDLYGGAVLNAAISLYAHCSIEPTADDQVSFHAADLDARWSGSVSGAMDVPPQLILHRAVHRRVSEEFNGGATLPIRVSTYADVPPGTGLGSSSTMVVAILKAYQELLSLPLGEYDLARLAYEIERVECGFAGGKQDQYAATFGGVNFIEFFDGDRVVVNPLRVKSETLNELEANLLLFLTGKSRSSERIIKDQARSAASGNGDAIEAMHEIKASAFRMKEVLLRSETDLMADIMRDSWASKKRTSQLMSNDKIDEILETALNAGGRSAKLSGAGGGGVMMVLIDPVRRFEVERALERAAPEGSVIRCRLAERGAESWRVGDPRTEDGT